MLLRRLVEVCTTAIALGFTLLVGSVTARAATLDVTYAFSGTPTITGITATTVYLSGTDTGSINGANPAVNAVWNPFTLAFMSQADIASGFLAGNFTITLANGETLSGIVNEDLSAVLTSPTLTGPFTQVLIFTGGTGEFAGVSGSLSGTGNESFGGASVSGSGTLTLPGAAAPEPASIELMLGGLGFLAAGYRRRRS